MKSICYTLLMLFFFCACKPQEKYETKTAESNGYSYEYVTNDPLNVRIYTLKNGLKVYLSRYDAQPRIMTSIAVKAGGKFDPANATGLAHYLEHIMFKGSTNFGTQDWGKEQIYLDSIEQMFEHYRTLTDSTARMDYYKQIDKISNTASSLAIANEYDKMVAEIGAKGTNAYTTEDRTVYVNDIPANQLENWLTLESDRFRQIVPRLFHTELEAVYEEKNRGMDNDYWKTNEALYVAAFKKHPYGTQTVIGTVAHLKNPSITEIKNYFNKYYRPNNVALCLSGDLDFDKTIALVDKYFGEWKPNSELKPWSPPVEEPIAKPVEMTVYGPNSEWLTMAFRFNGTASSDTPLLRLTDMILSNSKAGLIDLNLKQQQKVLEPYSFVDNMNDFSLHIFSANPREGQTLKGVKKLLLDQIDLLKKGQFDDWLIEAVINDLKKSALQQSQSNQARSNEEVMAFTNDISWKDYISRNDALTKYTKEDVVNFANEHYKDNYVVVYKLNGKDTTQEKITKPSISKVSLNKESISPFHTKLLANNVEKIQPKFVDYEKDIKKLKMDKGVEILYTKNSENELFSLYYLLDVGTNTIPKMKEATEYLEYLGTGDITAEDVKKEFYKLGCDFGVSSTPEQTYLYLSGLSSNMNNAIELFEKLLNDPKPDDVALKKMIDGLFQERDDNKKDKHAILWDGLMNYGLYGAKSPFTNVLTNHELRELKASELTDIIKAFTKTEHHILYFGPEEENKILASLNTHHKLPDHLSPVPTPVEFEIQNMDRPSVYWTNYDMVQAEILFVSKGDKFDAKTIPRARMFNEYFGGSMSSPVFQELREAQGLAYSAYATYDVAEKKSANNFFVGYIGTQADKQQESMHAMTEIIQNFPQSQSGLNVAKSSLMNQLESERITNEKILFDYEQARRLGQDHDVRKDVYDQIPKMTLDDVAAFQHEYIKGKKFNVMLVGDRKKLNLKDLEKYGKVKELTLDELFGYEKPVKIKVE